MKKKGNIKNLKPFQKGQSGNPGGRPKSESMTALLRKYLEGEEYVLMRNVELLSPAGNPTGKTVDVRFKAVNKTIIVKTLIGKAAKGDIRAVDLIFNRHDGAVNQKIEIEDRKFDYSLLTNEELQILSYLHEKLEGKREGIEQ